FPNSVGVGTTAPQQNLSVDGFMNVDQSGSDDGSVCAGCFHGITFGNQSGEGIGSRRTAGAGQYDLSIYGNWVPRITVQNSTGNVGIGNTLPNSALDVGGAIRITPTVGTAGSVEIFSVIGNGTSRTGTALCQTVTAQSACLGYFQSGGTAS